MAKRATKSTKRKSAPKKTPSARAKPRAKAAASKSEEMASLDANKRALWNTYRELQGRVDRALDKLHMHCQQRAAPSVLLQDKQELLFLLGECNYMARMCASAEAAQKKRR